MEKFFYMSGNENSQSSKVKENIVSTAKKYGFKLAKEFNEDCLFYICVGGDGSFIHAIHNAGFPETPFIGVNTGHLGFYQELNPDNIDYFFNAFIENKYNLEELAVLECTVETKREIHSILGINEIAIRGEDFQAIHLEVFIDKNFLEHFFGDGLIISTPVGSTAYNFSLGGAIVYPSLNTMQLSPLAPITNKIYRSLTNGIVVPGDIPISLFPYNDDKAISIAIDGENHPICDVKRIESKISKKTVKKIVLSNESYWNNLRDKIL